MLHSIRALVRKGPKTGLRTKLSHMSARTASNAAACMDRALLPAESAGVSPNLG